MNQYGDFLDRANGIMERHLTASNRFGIVFHKIVASENELLGLIGGFPELPPIEDLQAAGIRHMNAWDEVRESVRTLADVNMEMLTLLGEFMRSMIGGSET